MIVVESKNGEHNIMLNRRLARERNRQEDMAWFAELANNPMNSLHKPTVEKTLRNGKTKTVIDKSRKEIWERGDKLTQKIIRLFQDHPELPEYQGAVDEQSVTLDMIAKLARDVVNSPVWVQLDYCREPNRQTSDELVQFEIRKQFLRDWRVENLSAGYLTLHRGDFVEHSAGVSKARSIDFRMTKGRCVVYDFAKFAKVAGGGQKHQVKESEYFIAEVKQYIDRHDTATYFVDTLDGEWAETWIPKHQALIKGYEHRLFVGNTEQVIDWVEGL